MIQSCPQPESTPVCNREFNASNIEAHSSLLQTGQIGLVMLYIVSEALLATALPFFIGRQLPADH